MKLVLFLSSIFLSSVTQATLECFPNGKFRFIVDTKTIIKPTAYCNDPEKKLLMSSNCKTNTNCKAKKKRYLPDNYEALDGTYGDPLFGYCNLFDGTPAVVEYQIKNQWKETSICTFDDKSFINLSYFYTDVIEFSSVGNAGTESM